MAGQSYQAGQLTPRETTTLQDQMRYEKVCTRKYSYYAQRTTDPTVRNMFNEFARDEQNHFDTLNRLAGGSSHGPAQQAFGWQGFAQRQQFPGQTSTGWGGGTLPLQGQTLTRTQGQVWPPAVPGTLKPVGIPALRGPLDHREPIDSPGQFDNRREPDLQSFTWKGLYGPGRVAQGFHQAEDEASAPEFDGAIGWAHRDARRQPEDAPGPAEQPTNEPVGQTRQHQPQRQAGRSPGRMEVGALDSLGRYEAWATSETGDLTPEQPASIAVAQDTGGAAPAESTIDLQAMLADMLMSEKFVSSAYDNAIFDMTNPEARQALQQIQRDEQKHGERISRYMQEHGMQSKR